MGESMTTRNSGSISQSVIAAALPNKGNQALTIDPEPGIVQLAFLAKGSSNVVSAFERARDGAVVRSHDDRRVVNESVKNSKLANIPVAPGSVVLDAPYGVVADSGRDGFLYPRNPATGPAKGLPVGKLDYFTGQIRWETRFAPKTTAIEVDAMTPDELEQHLMGEPVTRSDVKASYLQTTLIKAGTRRRKTINIGPSDQIKIFIASESKPCRVRIDL